jgi:hypothetical protein
MGQRFLWYLGWHPWVVLVLSLMVGVFAANAMHSGIGLLLALVFRPRGKSSRFGVGVQIQGTSNSSR